MRLAKFMNFRIVIDSRPLNKYHPRDALNMCIQDLKERKKSGRLLPLSFRLLQSIILKVQNEYWQYTNIELIY